MTSEIEATKTNEFLRRRKLRLQQVREQSKDIAKKIRQRAKFEKIRQVASLDAIKEKEYFEKQDKLVKHLEHLYAKGVGRIGDSHQKASEIRQQDVPEKTDLSKLRGREAAAELRRKKQEKLDEQKKLLDRKVQAREAANEISREKSSTVVNKVLKSLSSKCTEETNSKLFNVPNNTLATRDSGNEAETNNAPDAVIRSDMATQWEYDQVPNEWEPTAPTVPTLSLPKDDGDSIKETNNNIESKTERSKRLDLFALSDEMPTSLRGGLTNVPEERVPVKSSLTLVSEYLQNRGLRLREPDTSSSNKKVSEDLQNIKQTILRTRASRTEGNIDICHVVDEQVVPVPSWRAETNCGFCSPNMPRRFHPVKSHQYQSVTNSQINKIFSSIRPVNQDLLPSPVLRGTSPFRRSKVSHRPFKYSARSNIEKTPVSSSLGSVLTKKNSVTMYNHSTRNTRDILCNDEGLVVRDLQGEDDAYSQAMKESSVDNTRESEHQKKLQDMRNKIAMTRHNVEKEYKDTMTFLNSLPKDKGNKPIRNAYMDEHRQQMQKENREQKMQQEFKKIAKDCKKHSCMKNANTSRSKSKSPAKIDDDFDARDFQYSWMPVPEGDSSLAIHTIPTTVKEGKSGNTVKFSKVDSYHEYRSRHKHTPPTKDTATKETNKKVVETVIIEKDGNESSDSSVSSDTSSIENLELSRDPKNKGQSSKNPDQNLSDAERIVIYKILESKKGKGKKKTKLLNDIAKSLNSIDIEKINNYFNRSESQTKLNSEDNKKVSVEQVSEGIYKAVNQNGTSYNIMSYRTTNLELWQTTTDCKPWWDNMSTMYFSDPQGGDIVQLTGEKPKHSHSCHCNRQPDVQETANKDSTPQWESGDSNPVTRSSSTGRDCKCKNPDSSKTAEDATLHVTHPSAATSTSSFKTANNKNIMSAVDDAGYVKLIDEVGKEAGKFYIGATGFLKDDDYEVIIQLRKKEAAKEEKKVVSKEVTTEETESTENAVSSAGAQAVVDKSDKPVTNTPRDVEIEASPQTSEVGQVPETLHLTLASQEEHRDQIARDPIASNKADTPAAQISVSKPDPLPRPATSTYTQTSFDSPVQRPMLIHMSSSTSTAYMSPPELILPKFLKQDYLVPFDEMYDPVHNYNCHSRHKISRKQYSDDYENCKCKRCATGNRKSCMRHDGAKLHIKKLQTPPNTARTYSSDQTNDMSSHNFKKPRSKCHKRDCRKGSDSQTVSQIYKTNITTKKQSQGMRGSSTASSSYKNRNNTKPKPTSKSNLNPVIKQYVNKLLALNKEGLKAIEVVNQECSSVSTPGSSIVDMPSNADKNNPVEKKISLEQIRSLLKQQILEEHKSRIQAQTVKMSEEKDTYSKKPSKTLIRRPKKKPIHKVKSFNISKHLLKNTSDLKKTSDKFKPISTSSSTKEESTKERHFRRKSSPSKNSNVTEYNRKSTSSEILLTAKDTEKDTDEKLTSESNNFYSSSRSQYKAKTQQQTQCPSSVFPSNKATLTTTSPESATTGNSLKYRNISNAHYDNMDTSTQTSDNIDSEINFMKLAEDKLQNMEKIADLTEKCTKRLSNLAKVLEEVRRNKSLVYSQCMSASESASDSDQKSDKNAVSSKLSTQSYPITKMQDKIEDIENKASDPESTNEESSDKDIQSSLEYVPFFLNIPKPNKTKPSPTFESNKLSEDKTSEVPDHKNSEQPCTKVRAKPPPALSRIHLKHAQDHIIPHELSTVIEVDSPMSVKLKNQSSRNDTKHDKPDSPDRCSKDDKEGMQEKELNKNTSTEKLQTNPDILQTSKRHSKMSSNESSDDSKMQMMDLKQFNEIMLKPFVSVQEYAKQFNIGAIDEGSNLEDLPKDDVVNDELSSLHSDGSLPDVIAELLKRNVISEPFKFDSASNVNSTTVSSESTLSVLALSKVRKEKKKSSVLFQNKENLAETSDTLSISSNPDLENAFKKLGMGWASSTLKKTKERLALSSSSNTSSSSLTQFKVKSFNHQGIPAPVTDSLSSASMHAPPKNKSQSKHTLDNSKNVEQQTSMSNSMTVKEFLNNELAKKITFTNRSSRNDTEEFVSLYETKMPEAMKHSSQMIREERSVDSIRSGSINRARTSTPVQIYKSMAYHSSSSSNVSNGLFSNADDLSSVKVTSTSIRNHSTSDKDDLTIPNISLKIRKGSSECSKSD